MLTRIYLSLGSNIGNRESQLRAALSMLRIHGIDLRLVSSVYATAPQDVANQPWFLNIAVECTTALPVLETLQALHTIEAALGRDRTRATARGPRTIDVDLLLYDEQVVQTPLVQVPHPRMTERRFVLEPLLEIAPGLRHPITGQFLREYLPGVADQAVSLHLRDPAVLLDPVSPPSR